VLLSLTAMVGWLAGTVYTGTDHLVVFMFGPTSASSSSSTSATNAPTTAAELGSNGAFAAKGAFQKLVDEKNRNGALVSLLTLGSTCDGDSASDAVGDDGPVAVNDAPPGDTVAADWWDALAAPAPAIVEADDCFGTCFAERSVAAVGLALVTAWCFGQLVAPVLTLTFRRAVLHCVT
jgi:hypothetical protein